METKANFVLVGVMTLLAMVSALGFALWLAKVQLDRSYATYDILFDSVSGLARGSPVRFNGVDVGQVVDIALSRSDPSLVRVRIEVSADTPVRRGTVARRESQGVTGVSFVGLEGGQPDGERLERDPETGYPVIPSEPSVVEGLIEDAPDLLNEAIALLRDIKAFTSDENRAAVARILKNVDGATAKLDTAIDDVTRITADVSTGSSALRPSPTGSTPWRTAPNARSAQPTARSSGSMPSARRGCPDHGGECRGLAPDRDDPPPRRPYRARSRAFLPW